MLIWKKKMGTVSYSVVIVASLAFIACEIWLIANVGIVDAVLIPVGALLVAMVVTTILGAVFGDNRSSDSTMAPLIAVIILTVILYGFSFSKAWTRVSLEHAVYNGLVKEVSQNGFLIKKSIINDLFDLDSWSRGRIVENIRRNPSLRSNIESVLYRLAKEEGGGNPGVLLAEVSSRSDWDLLRPNIRQCALLLDNNADWKDAPKAKRLYDMLKAFDKRVIPLLIDEVINPDGRLQILFLTVKLGIPSSEDSLCRALEEHGDKQMAEDYLNSGSSKLSFCARHWAAGKGYPIVSGQGSHRSSWGNF
jgi:hypothetical protein